MAKKGNDRRFIKKPTYIGGLKAMREFIAKEMKYPKSALENKVEGSVFIKYEVDHKGNVISSRVLSSLGYGCDEEAIRLVSKLKFYVSKNPRKLRIKFNKSIRIKFRLPKKKVVKLRKNQRSRRSLYLTILQK
jgi:protein TonB